MFGVQNLKIMLVPNIIILSTHTLSYLKHKFVYEPALCIDWVTCIVHTGLQLDLGNPNFAKLTLQSMAAKHMLATCSAYLGLHLSIHVHIHRQGGEQYSSDIIS
jgi:hypothetical protein